MFGREQAKRNLSALYINKATARLWFDGGLWVLYLQHRGVGLFTIGLLEAWLHIVSLFSDIPVGILADRFGWKLSLACSHVLGVAYGVLALVGNGAGWFFAAFAARGLQATLESGADTALAFESASQAGLKHRFRRISGHLYAISLVSMAAAETAGGAIASHTWAWVYGSYAAAQGVAFLTTLLITEPRQSEKCETQPMPVWQIVRDAARFAKRDHRFARWLLFSGTLSGCAATFGFYGQSLMKEAGWTLVGLGILAGASNIAGAAAALSADGMVRWLGERRSVWWQSAATALGLVCMAALPWWGKGIGYLCSNVALSLADPVIENRLHHIVPSEQRATLMSANSTAFSVFMIACFPAFGWAAGRYGLAISALVGSIAGTAAILGVYCGVRRYSEP